MVSFAGAAVVDVPPPLLLEPHPAAAPASATIVPIAAADLVNFTGGSPFPDSFLVSRVPRPVSERLRHSCPACHGRVVGWSGHTHPSG
jgi:hypothetical protein